MLHSVYSICSISLHSHCSSQTFFLHSWLIKKLPALLLTQYSQQAEWSFKQQHKVPQVFHCWTPTSYSNFYRGQFSPQLFQCIGREGSSNKCYRKLVKMFMSHSAYYTLNFKQSNHFPFKWEQHFFLLLLTHLYCGNLLHKFQITMFYNPE